MPHQTIMLTMAEAAPLQQVNRTYVRYQNRKFSYFSGCDYFRLSSHPAVVRALKQGVDKFGLNVAASRQTTGNHRVYYELEAALAKFFGAQNALLVSTGYLTNLVVGQALSGNFSHALLDERAHASLADAARFLDCPILRFKYCDVEDLARCVERCGQGAKVMLLTDGLFSHNGSVAPLGAYLKHLPKDAMLLVDDAHGAGVVGKQGRGSLEHAQVSRRQIIQTITLSKAFGVYGGAVLATRSLRDRIMARSTLFTAGTPLPLPLANAVLRSVGILRTNPGLRQRLNRNATYVRNGLRQRGFSLPEAPGPIIAFEPMRAADARVINRALLKSGVYPPFIRYPGGPDGGYFRFVISSEHTRQQLDALVAALGNALTDHTP